MPKKVTNQVISTGPKTEAGKKVASMNATKHGLTAKNWLNEKEQEQFQSLLDSLIEEYELQTPTELLLAERVANIATRLKRFQTVEDALFATAREQASSVDKLIASYELDYDTATDAARVIAGLLQPLINFNYELYDELLNAKDFDEISDYGYVIKNMPHLRKSLFNDCRNEHQDIAELIGGKGSSSQHSALPSMRIVFVNRDVQEETSKEKTDEELDESGLKVSADDIRAYIGDQIEILHRKLLLNDVLESHIQRKELLTNSAMPNSDVMDRLMRYQTSLDRQFSKALGELLHVIDRRK